MRGRCLVFAAACALIPVAMSPCAVADDPFSIERGRSGPDEQEIDARARAAAKALTAAEADGKRRGITTPDAAFVKLLESRYRRTLLRLAPSSASLLPPLSSDALLSEPMYVENVVQHFRRQAAGIVASDGTQEVDRIIGGLPARKSTDVVAMITDDGDPRSLCSGVMISSRAVATAAHCYCEVADADLIIRVGQDVRDGEEASNGFTSYVVENVRLFGGGRCPAFDKDKHKSRKSAAYRRLVAQSIVGRDLAVLWADGTIQKGKPRKLLSPAGFRTWAAQRDTVTAVGYGYSAIVNGEPRGAGRRLWADLAVAQYVCKPGNGFGCEPDKELVAAAKSNAANANFTCNHDSGGPIYARFRSSDGKKEAFTIGLTSRGLNQNCSAGTIFTLLARDDVQSWLQQFGAEIAK